MLQTLSNCRLTKQLSRRQILQTYSDDDRLYRGCIYYDRGLISSGRCNVQFDVPQHKEVYLTRDVAISAFMGFDCFRNLRKMEHSTLGFDHVFGLVFEHYR